MTEKRIWQADFNWMEKSNLPPPSGEHRSYRRELEAVDKSCEELRARRNENLEYQSEAPILPPLIEDI